MPDIPRTCQSCGRTFQFSGEKQQLFARLAAKTGHVYEPPRRCYRCRKARRAGSFAGLKVTKGSTGRA
jgi:hypothetical protein